MIDCQQNTRHLASLGAREIAARDFVRPSAPGGRGKPLCALAFEPVYWANSCRTTDDAA
jgi:leucyl/phenylalanyl-tRNA--protein transferase